MCMQNKEEDEDNQDQVNLEVKLELNDKAKEDYIY